MKKLILISLFFFSVSAITQSSLNMNLLFHWEDSGIVRTSLHDNAYNEVWGYVSNGREYAIIGSTRGTHVFDVTDPVNSVEVDFVWGRDTGTQIVHRDYHDYKGYLYVVSDEADASLQIIDLSYLPDSVSVVFDSDIPFKRAHNIFIDSTTDKMYVCGGENQFNVYDITSPLLPTLLKKCHLDIPWWSSTVGQGGYVHDVYVRNDTVWCNAGNGLYVVDFTNMTSPSLLASLTSYPDGGYNHSGWLNEAGNIYALADETHGKKVKIFDVSDLSNIQFLDTIGSDVATNSIAHNLIFKGNLLYVSYYFDGLYVWDMTNPSNPVLTGFYDTSDELNFNSYKGNWGVYPFLPSGIVLASDMQRGLFIFDVSQATDLSEIINKNRFKVFPNPFEGEINLVGLAGFNESYDATLMDVSGKLIISKKINNTFLSHQQISVPSSLPKGAYFLTIKNKSFVQTIKLVKQ
jgi:choice-of-anchor B domain-containing protein